MSLSQSAVVAFPPASRTTSNPRVSVIVPARNEAKNLPYVIGEIPADVHEIIVVDGRSTDGTADVARSLDPRVRVIGQTGRGKGDALAAGFAAVTGDIVVMLDADCSADPGEIPLFVAALVAGADVAKGSRYLDSGGSADITFLRSSGNRVLTKTVNFLFGTRYTDLCYGYMAFWTHCLPPIDIDCDGFEVETLINIRIAKAGLRIVEVGSYEFERRHGTSNLNALRDGIRVGSTIVKEMVGRRGTPKLDLVERRSDARGDRLAEHAERRSCHLHTSTLR